MTGFAAVAKTQIPKNNLQGTVDFSNCPLLFHIPFLVTFRSLCLQNRSVSVNFTKLSSALRPGLQYILPYSLPSWQNKTKNTSLSDHQHKYPFLNRVPNVCPSRTHLPITLSHWSHFPHTICKYRHVRLLIQSFLLLSLDDRHHEKRAYESSSLHPALHTDDHSKCLARHSEE